MGPPDNTPELLSHVAWLRSLAGRLVADRATVDDVVQEAMVAALDARSRGAASPEGLRSWLGGVVRHLSRGRRRSAMRRMHREGVVARPEALASTADIAERAELSRALMEAVFELPDGEREVVLLRYFEDLQPKAIAARLGIPGSTARVRLVRAHERLRERLERGHGGPRDLALALLPLAVPGGSLPHISPPGPGPGEVQRVALSPNATGAAGTTILMTAKTPLLAIGAVALISGGAFLLTRSRPATPSTPTDPGVVRVDSPSPPSPTDVALDPSAVHGVDSGPRVTAAPKSPAPLSGDPCCLVGEVLGSEGPLSGARLVAEELVDMPGGRIGLLEPPEPARVTTTSDALGHFRLPVAPDKRYRVQAEDGVHVEAVASPCVAGDVLSLRLETGVTLEVLVVDSQAVPVQGVECSADDAGRHWGRTGTTNEEGRARLERLPLGEVRVWGNPRGATSTRHDLGPAYADLQLQDPPTTLVLELPPAAVLAGEVRDATTNEPVVGAQVTLNRRSATSDREGRFRFGGFHPSTQATYVLEVAALGYRAKAQEFVPPGEAREKAFVVHLDRGPTGILRVVDTGGAPIANARVTQEVFLRSSPFSGGRLRREFTSDAEGQVRIDGLVPGAPHDFVAHAQGRGTAVFRVVPEEPSGELDLGTLVLSAAGAIGGRVETDLDPPGMVLLEIPHPTGDVVVDGQILGSGGEFHFEGLAAGTWRLAHHARTRDGQDHEPAARAFRTVELEAGQVLNHLLLRVGDSLHGVARSSEGRGVGDVLVILTDADGARIEGRTGDDGGFVLPATGAAPFELELIDLSLRFAPWKRSGIRPGTGHAGPIEASLLRQATEHAITGRLVPPPGATLLQGVFVRFVHRPTGRALARVGVPDTDGGFAMENLWPGTYDLTLVDFEQHYEPLVVEAVDPDGPVPELMLEERSD